ncbi:MAG TPA: hypothetical protein VLE70_08950 [Anaerolineae bacterium]|jgi:hypothetical protein|nr:hypothetical protein [Anaerolineae bacterium]
MTTQLMTEEVWQTIEKELFAVLGMVTPKKEFVTYGVGVSLMQMRDTKMARGRVPVGNEASREAVP